MFGQEEITMLDGCACVEKGVRYAHSIGTGKRDVSLTIVTGTSPYSVWFNYSLHPLTHWCNEVSHHHCQPIAIAHHTVKVRAEPVCAVLVSRSICHDNQQRTYFCEELRCQHSWWQSLWYRIVALAWGVRASPTPSILCSSCLPEKIVVYLLSSSMTIPPSSGRWVSVTARMDKRQRSISLASFTVLPSP